MVAGTGLRFGIKGNIAVIPGVFEVYLDGVVLEIYVIQFIDQLFFTDTLSLFLVIPFGPCIQFHWLNPHATIKSWDHLTNLGLGQK